MTPQTAILTSLPQEHVLLLAVIDRLLEAGVDFQGFSENAVPQKFSPELLNSQVLFIDRGALNAMTAEEKKLLEEFSRTRIVSCFDYTGNADDRTLANFYAEITVNGALA